MHDEPRTPRTPAARTPRAPRSPVIGALIIVAVVIASLIAVILAPPAKSRASGVRATAPSAPRVVAAVRIAPTPGTLPRGTVVRSSALGPRVFPSARRGFALADVGGAQYPAMTTNAGRVWRIDGPALHLNAAQAPLVVTQIGAVSPRTVFVWGGPSGGPVIDVTNDGGRHWWRATIGDVVLAVIAGGRSRLIAVAQAATESGDSAVTWVYFSTDGGRHWRYTNHLAAQ